MSTFPVRSDLLVEGVDAADLRWLLDLLGRRGGRRWAARPEGGAWRLVRAGDGQVETAEDPAVFCREQGEPGVALETAAFERFASRFPDAEDPDQVARMAAVVAPLLPDLVPADALRGLNWDMTPAVRTQRVLEVIRRFLPKERSVAARVDADGRRFGLAILFDRDRRVGRIVGWSGWPEAARNGELKQLRGLGPAVEMGLDLDARGFEALLHERLDRAGFAALIRDGHMRLDPLPMTIRLALKAARIA